MLPGQGNIGMARTRRYKVRRRPNGLRAVNAEPEPGLAYELNVSKHCMVEPWPRAINAEPEPGLAYELHVSKHCMPEPSLPVPVLDPNWVG